MSAERMPAAPSGLKRAGRLLWTRLMRGYVFETAQLELVKRLAESEDRLVEVRTKLAEEGSMLDRKLLKAEGDLVNMQLRVYRALKLNQDSPEEQVPYDSRQRQLAAVNGHAGRRKVL